MRPTLFRLAALLLAASSAAAGDGPAPLRIAWIGPLSGPLKEAGEESLLGVRAAADGWQGKRPVEVVPFDDGDDPKAADGLLADAQKAKFAAVVAMSTGLTVDAVAARARRGRVPVLVAGTAPPPASADPEDPLMFVGPWPVDQAMNMTNFLAIHSDKSGLGLYRDSMEPAIVAEDTPRGREMAAAVARNLGPRQHLSGQVFVPPHGAPLKEDLQKLRAARCDRLLLIGEPDLVDRTADAMKEISWEVPLFCADGMLSRAAVSLRDGRVRKANFLFGVPARAQTKAELPPDVSRFQTPVDGMLSALARRLPEGTPVYSRTRIGWFAAWMVLQAAESVKRPSGSELIAGIRALGYTHEEEWGRPYLDEAGRAALYQWFAWTMGEKGPEPIKASYLPTRDIGPMLRSKRVADWDRVEINEETQVVWLTFGEKEPKVKSENARTIEEDLAALGLNSSGYEAEMDPWLLEELQTRTLGKLNRAFLKNYDGTFVPGVSWNIHFTFTKPEKRKGPQPWTGLIAGEMNWDKAKNEPKADDPGGMASGNLVHIYSRWMRYHMAIRDKKLKPRMNREDRKYMDGTYSWGTSWEENFRGDSIRAVLDGYADGFALTGAHELGHVCGCNHDTESKRSIMNVVDGVGIRTTQACWIPMHVKALDTALGRYPGKAKR